MSFQIIQFQFNPWFEDTRNRV